MQKKLLYYLLMALGRRDGFMSFPRTLARKGNVSGFGQDLNMGHCGQITNKYNYYKELQYLLLGINYQFSRKNVPE